MVALHPQLLARSARLARFGRRGRLGARRPAPAAILHGILSAAFLFLSARQMGGRLDASAGRALADVWWALELTAIWCVPAVWLLSRFRGGGTLLARGILPLVAATALAIGLYRESTAFLSSGFGLCLLLAKCVSLRSAGSSRLARELFAMRVLVGFLAGLLAAAAAGAAVVCIREVFAPAALQGAGAARGVLLLSGTFYFATLAVLEEAVAPPAGPPADARA